MAFSAPIGFSVEKPDFPSLTFFEEKDPGNGNGSFGREENSRNVNQHQGPRLSLHATRKQAFLTTATMRFFAEGAKNPGLLVLNFQIPVPFLEPFFRFRTRRNESLHQGPTTWAECIGFLPEAPRVRSGHWKRFVECSAP